MLPTPKDLLNLRAFVAALGETEWNPDYEPEGPCTGGGRLVKLGWIELVRSACRSTGGFMGGSYHPARYRLTPAGKIAATPA